MSKLGFDRSLLRVMAAEERFFRLGIAAAKREFKRNFDYEFDSEFGRDWRKLKIPRDGKILDDTGNLRSQVLGANYRVLRNYAELQIDAIDKRGRNYASYHMDGTTRMVKRRYLTQSDMLTKQQLNILTREFGKIFR